MIKRVPCISLYFSHFTHDECIMDTALMDDTSHTAFNINCINKRSQDQEEDEGRLDAWDQKKIGEEQTRYSNQVSHTKEPRLYKGIARRWSGYGIFSCNSDLVNVVGKDGVVDVMVSERRQGVQYFAGWAEDLKTTRMRFPDFLRGDAGETATWSYYLAQAPIVSRGAGGMVPGCMYGLTSAIEVPWSVIRESASKTYQISSVNAWCSVGEPSLSSLHYDCHDNLLCTVRGTKVVRCCPFETIRVSLFEDSAYEYGYGNHCRRKYTLFPEYEEEKMVPQGCGDTQYSLSEFVVSAGNALYIPEGTWHQVYSFNESNRNDRVVLAINFWWDGDRDARSCVSKAYAQCMQYNTQVTEYASKYLDEYAQLARVHIDTIIQANPNIKEHEMLQGILRHISDPDRRMLLLESCLAYHYCKGFQALYEYLYDMAYRVVPSLSKEERLCLWESTTPTAIEYLTSGLSHLSTKDGCISDEQTSLMYQKLYSTMDDMIDFSFPRLLADRKVAFKRFLAHHVPPYQTSAMPHVSDTI